MTTSETASEISATGRMKKKHLVTIFCVIVGGSSAAAVGLWPQYTAAIQMTLYTIMVFGSVFLGLWSERRRSAFWVGIWLAFLTHGLILYGIRSTFPFRSILIVVPIALAEAVAMLAAMLRILGDHTVKRPKRKDGSQIF